MGSVFMLGVQELLNGVDLEGTRRAEPERGKAEPKIQVFVSYSHKDEELKEQLGTHLKIFQRQGLITLWHDRLDHSRGGVDRADRRQAGKLPPHSPPGKRRFHQIGLLRTTLK